MHIFSKVKNRVHLTSYATTMAQQIECTFVSSSHFIGAITSTWFHFVDLLLEVSVACD